jgi:hypothetical protein
MTRLACHPLAVSHPGVHPKTASNRCFSAAPNLSLRKGRAVLLQARYTSGCRTSCMLCRVDTPGIVNVSCKGCGVDSASTLQTVSVASVADCTLRQSRCAGLSHSSPALCLVATVEHNDMQCMYRRRTPHASMQVTWKQSARIKLLLSSRS